jgi:hypothetical protein
MASEVRPSRRRAWTEWSSSRCGRRPVFDLFRAVSSDAIYTQVYRDWLQTHAAAVVSVCLDQDMDIFVAEDAGKVAWYVAVAMTKIRQGPIYA